MLSKGTAQVLRKLCLGVSVLLIAGTTLNLAAADKATAKAGGNGVYSFGLWGDVPYSDLQATVGVPNLIRDMNSQDLAFTAHDGDLKAGSGPCTNFIYVRAQGYFNSLHAPAIFTPGDNDWTDCDRTDGYNSLVQLEKERRMFFSTPYTMGENKLQQEVQTDALCLGVSGNVPCVENRRWTIGGVTYATLNIQGSCNNLCDTAPDPNEYAARNHADIVWMQQTFAEAQQLGSAAVMFISQADPGWDDTDGTRAPTRDPQTLAQDDGNPDGYQEFLLALRDQVIAFGKPVAYVHGDSHYFRLDKPFLDANGKRLQNFTRVETFGDHQENGNNDVNWLKVTVDTSNREVFSYQPQIVPSNQQ